MPNCCSPVVLEHGKNIKIIFKLFFYIVFGIFGFIIVLRNCLRLSFSLQHSGSVSSRQESFCRRIHESFTLLNLKQKYVTTVLLAHLIRRLVVVIVNFSFVYFSLSLSFLRLCLRAFLFDVRYYN